MADVEKNFFQEMDEKRRSMSRPWTVLIVIFILFFGLAVYGLVKVRNSLRRIDFAGWNLDMNLGSVSLGKKIANLSQTKNSNYSFSINSTDLSAYLNLSDDNFPLKNCYAKINPDVIVFYGRLRSSRLGLPVGITLKAESKDGQLILTPQPTDLEKIYLPAETQDRIASEISARINLDLNLSGKFMVGSVSQDDNSLTINMILRP